MHGFPDLTAKKVAQDFDAAISKVVSTFNKKYALVNEAGKAVIFQEGFDAVLKRRILTRIATRDLITLYMNDKIQVGVDDKDRPVYRSKAAVWLSHPDRKQYIDGVAFDPTTTESQPGILNLWKGYAVQPVPGNWSLMRAHICRVICDGDSVRSDYLILWMARMLQRPAEQGEVAVVMKGGEGSGKGTLARALLKIIGHHGLAISNAKHLIGNFNGHLRDAVFLFADEAFFAGDRAHVGVLKSIITEPYLTVEAKFQNAVQMANFLHIMMASNEDWVIPASLDARRFLVLVVSEDKKKDYEYFAALWAQMDAGGYAAMLHDLLTLDISTFNVRNVPVTEGLQQQRKLSLPIPEAWWKDCLERGYVFQSKLGLEDHFQQWHETMATELLFGSYERYASDRRDRHILSREDLGKFLVRMGLVAKRLSKQPVGEHVANVENPFGGTSRVAKLIMNERPTGYHIGTLSPSRDAFTKAVGLQVDWFAEIEGHTV